MSFNNIVQYYIPSSFIISYSQTHANGIANAALLAVAPYHSPTNSRYQLNGLNRDAVASLISPELDRSMALGAAASKYGVTASHKTKPSDINTTSRNLSRSLQLPHSLLLCTHLLVLCACTLSSANRKYLRFKLMCK
jgi:hypothetical protein